VGVGGRVLGRVRRGAYMEAGLDRRAVDDHEAEQENRQCRNWPDHVSSIGPNGLQPDPSNRGPYFREDDEVARLPLVTLLAVVAWSASALWADQHVGSTGQLGIGVVTAARLAALLAFHSRTVRLQTLAVVGIATCGEVIGSLIWGLYHYRLANIPAFVPPGHGL